MRRAGYRFPLRSGIVTVAAGQRDGRGSQPDQFRAHPAMTLPGWRPPGRAPPSNPCLRRSTISISTADQPRRDLHMLVVPDLGGARETARFPALRLAAMAAAATANPVRRR